MATTNPYAGQQDMDWYELAWNQGYVYGTEHPAEDQPQPPTVFPPLVGTDGYLTYLQQVWSEGDLAARSDRHPKVQHIEPGESPLAVPEHVIDGAHVAYEVGHAIVAGTVTVGEIGAGAIGIFVALIGMTEPGDEELAQQDLRTWFRQACDQYNCADLFLAVEWPTPDHTDAWYGPQVHNTFDGAKDDAARRLADYPHNYVQVAHYKSTNPDMLELIELVQQ
jgi:hypothetical protein